MRSAWARQAVLSSWKRPASCRQHVLDPAVQTRQRRFELGLDLRDRLGHRVAVSLRRSDFRIRPRPRAREHNRHVQRPEHDCGR